MKSKKILVEFADSVVPIESLHINNTYEGVFEGDPAIIAKMLLRREAIKATNEVAICYKLIEPRDKSCLPTYRYEMFIKQYVPKEHPEYDGDSDWYFLKLVWFDYAPDPTDTLNNYIGTITKTMNFYDVCKKLTEDQKEYWL